MGCDIHIRVERRASIDSPWEVVKPGDYLSYGDMVRDWPTPRQYFFFALVADVRNMDDVVEPIAPARGLPSDMASEQFANDRFGEEYEEADAAGLSDLGEHSFTWALLSELQEGCAAHRAEIHRDYLKLIYEDWPKLGDPGNVRVIMGFDS